jgi:Ca-activated chloride channel family protein
MEIERMSGSLRYTAVSLLAAVATLAGQQPAAPGPDDRPRFQSRVELVNVAATVSDASGRFVPGLREDDFAVYDDDARQAIAAFGTERLPVSLGIAVDTSGSMVGAKIDEARTALDQFLEILLDPQDEIFLYKFGDRPVLLEGWTTNRELLASALDRLKPDGGTAMYDTVADAVQLAAQGRNRKKALVVISDGNDTSSNTPRVEVRRLIHESEVLVYAVGIDGRAEESAPSRPPIPLPRVGRPPVPVPGGWGRPPGSRRQTAATRRAALNGDRVDAQALRDLTDDSGGRTEIIHDAHDLYPATASIADELSKQYDLSYTSTGTRDGRWHTIRVEVKNPAYRVRARRGYFAN